MGESVSSGTLSNLYLDMVQAVAFGFHEKPLTGTHFESSHSLATKHARKGRTGEQVSKLGVSFAGSPYLLR